MTKTLTQLKNFIKAITAFYLFLFTMVVVIVSVWLTGMEKYSLEQEYRARGRGCQIQGDFSAPFRLRLHFGRKDARGGWGNASFWLVPFRMTESLITL